ncbi:MAG: hypothetical protein GX778_02355 [Erysipelothrix sp.]|nr:hypothetical protein [Erysipelothrix sp.]
MTKSLNYNIDVVVKHYKDGRFIPLYIIWEDETKYKIDRITAIQEGASLKYGLQGMRFTCIIQNQYRYLFYNGTYWSISPVD